MGKKKDSFFSLIPERVQFPQFWVEIRKRNRWLIMLRYGAFVMLSFLIAGILILKTIIPEFRVNTLPLWIIAFMILLYNLCFNLLWNKLSKKRHWSESTSLPQGKLFNSLHFSLLQICFDIIALLLFIYYTGGVESPIFVFFIFHVIIGSLFFTQEIMGSIVTFIMFISIAGSYLELKGSIPHHAIGGLLSSPLYNNTGYLIIFFVTFGIALFTSIYLANSIAKVLYQRERALTKAYADLENAEITKSKYVQTIVHDLKTPISAAVTYLNMILEGSLGIITDAFQKPLERTKARLSYAIQTINDVLQISQLKIESSIEKIENIDLNKIIQEILSEINVIIGSQHIKLTYNSDATEPVIEAEPILIKLTLANLVSNAVKYTEFDGKIAINLTDSKLNVNFSIADDGIGIPDKDRGKIFQSFFRSSISKQKGIEGTGLGLSIVYEVVTKYHGTIGFNSPSYLQNGDLKPGTEFIVTLPKKYSAI